MKALEITFISKLINNVEKLTKSELRRDQKFERMMWKCY